MPRIIFTDEELEAVRLYFSNGDLRSYMNGRGKNGVSITLADDILAKVTSGGSTAPTTKTRVDAIWQAIKTASR